MNYLIPDEYIRYIFTEKINQEYKDTGTQECALYCTGCAFVTDATQHPHEEECLSSTNKELNRLAKLSITDFPLIENDIRQTKDVEKTPNRIVDNKLEPQRNLVLVVRRHKIIDLSEDLETKLLSQHPSIVDITFARTFFIEFSIGHPSIMSDLNGVNVFAEVENLSTNSTLSVNPMKAVFMAQSGYYKYFSQI